MADTALALPPAPKPARPRVLLVGTTFAAMASVMAMAGLIGVYLAERAAVVNAGGTWLPDGARLALASTAAGGEENSFLVAADGSGTPVDPDRWLSAHGVSA